MTSATFSSSTAHAVSAHQLALDDPALSAVNTVSENEAASALQVTGHESGRGSVKISHVKPISGASDANASALSIDIQGAGTAAQGIHVDATSGTTGALLDIRNNGRQLLKVLANGDIQLGNGGPKIVTDINGPAFPASSLALSPFGLFVAEGSVWKRLVTTA